MAGADLYRPCTRPQGAHDAGAKIEEFITLGALAGYLQRGEVPHVKVSQAYAALLQHAGAILEPEDVLDWLGDLDDQGEMGQRIGEMVTAIMTVLSPAAKMKGGAGEPPANPSPSPPASSKLRSA